MIGLGGVGLSCVMGAVLAEASRIVAIDRVPSKLDVARAIGATDGLLADGEPADTFAALRDLTDGGPDFVFEAIGLPTTAELAIAALPVGGTAVLVGMTPIGERASFEVYRLGAGESIAGRAADRPPHRARRSRGRVRRDARGAVRAPGDHVLREAPADARSSSSSSSDGAMTGGSGSSIGGSNGPPVISRVARPWVMNDHPHRTSTTSRLAKPIR